MNRNQYFAVSLFFLVLLFSFPYLVLSTTTIHHESVYYGVRNGILSVIIWLSFPLIILFSILALLEHKKKTALEQEDDEAMDKIVRFMKDKGGIEESVDKKYKKEWSIFSNHLKKKYPLWARKTKIELEREKQKKNSKRNKSLK